VALLPVAAALVAFAEPGLRLWLGSSYVPEAGAVLRWLSLAVYVNAVGQVAYAWLQSGVEARFAAYVHLVELPIFLTALAVAATRYGATGVAIAWFGRMAVDTVVMWAVVFRRIPAARHAVRRVAWVCAGCWSVTAVAAIWGATR
jgi:O-antigen/teichoic acid export membrane protein